jgi:hypothetical protein
MQSTTGPSAGAVGLGGDDDSSEAGNADAGVINPMTAGVTLVADEVSTGGTGNVAVVATNHQPSVLSLFCLGFGGGDRGQTITPVATGWLMGVCTSHQVI